MTPEEIPARSADNRVMFWQRLDLPGSEYCTFVESDGGWRFDGTVLLALDAAPLRVHYRIACDVRWQTRTVEIACMEGLEERAMQIAVDARQRWWIEGVERVELRGCLDVDLGVTPATNMLPIRRLGLAIGGSEEIAAAWVRFPEMTVARAMQRYTCVAAMRYRYESGTYRTEIDVDDSGFVIHYPEGWERVVTRAG